jgi:hypothetical protein
MRKQILLFSCAFTTCVYGQGITLGSDDFAKGGDTLRVSLATDDNYPYTLTGANYTWDFSKLTATSQQLKDFSPMSESSVLVWPDFRNPLSPQYLASYFTESMSLPIGQLTQSLPLPISIDNIRQYFKNASGSITNLGYSLKLTFNGIPADLSAPSDIIETVYKFPLKYGDLNTSKGYTKVKIETPINATFIQRIQRETEVDGYGTLTTPFGTFETLRLKHTIKEEDSIDLSPLGPKTLLPLPLRREYEWWAQGQKVPLLKFTTNELQGTETVVSIEYRDNYLGLDAGLDELGWKTELYPVPANDVLMVRSARVLDRIAVLDQWGRLVKSETIAHSSDALLEIVDLTPGVYTIVLFAEDSLSTEKFIKQ